MEQNAQFVEKGLRVETKNAKLIVGNVANLVFVGYRGGGEVRRRGQ